MRLLVVDDDHVTRFAVRNCLADKAELEVIACQSASEALRKLREGAPADRLLVDWNMPGMNGYELLRELRSDRRYDTMRILMLTSENSLQHVKLALAAGADEYLMKPFTKEMLLNKLALMDAA